MIPYDEFERRLKLIAAQAPALRRAGVTALSIDGVTMQYAPWEEPAATETAPAERPSEPEREPEIDALDDPSSYPDGVVPGYGPPDDSEEQATT